LYDNNKDAITPYLEESYKYIVDNADKKILVHCFMGASRSASFVIYYIMKKYNKTFDEALECVKDKRSMVNLSTKFEENLRTEAVKFEENLRTEAVKFDENLRAEAVKFDENLRAEAVKIEKKTE
jgi:protein-tyrosine phosphatase